MNFFRSFFQSVCVLGYCLLPTGLALIVCRIILLAEQTNLLFFLRFAVSMVGFAWATYGRVSKLAKVFHFPSFFCSFHGISRRQSKTGKESTCGLPHIPVLFYYFMAGYIAHKHISLCFAHSIDCKYFLSFVHKCVNISMSSIYFDKNVQYENENKYFNLCITCLIKYCVLNG